MANDLMEKLEMPAQVLLVVSALVHGLKVFGLEVLDMLPEGALMWVLALVGLSGLYGLYKLLKMLAE